MSDPPQDAGVDQERVLFDRLFRTPLAAFVKEREKLSAELRARGNRELAARVKGCPKPGAAAWAINQLALAPPPAPKTEAETKTHPARRAKPASPGDDAAEGAVTLERFVSVGDDLAAAHLAAGADAQSRQRYQAFLGEHRRLLGALVEAALGALAEGGPKPTPAQRERILTTLRAAAVDPGLRAAMLAGRLLRDAEPAGFEALAGLGEPSADERLVRLGAALAPGLGPQKSEGRKTARRSAQPDEARDADDGATKQAQEEHQAALRRMGELKEQLRFCRAGLERARQNQQDQSRRLERAQSTHARLESELADAKKALADQQSLLTEADRRLASIKQQEQKLMDELGALQ